MTFASNPALSICWAIMTVGEWYLAALCLRTILPKYPAFTVFIAFSALKSVALMYVSNCLSGHAYFVAYYATGFPAALLEMAVVIDIFAKLFRPYRYVPRKLMTALAFSVPLFIAIVTELNMMAWHNNIDATLGTYRVVERSATYSVLVLLGALLCFSSYFAMPWRSRLAGITIGMFLNSLTSVITSTLVTSLNREATYRLAFLPVLSFFACELIWIRYIRRPEELRAVVGPGEVREIRTMLNEFQLCLETTPISCRPEESQQEPDVEQ